METNESILTPQPVKAVPPGQVTIPEKPLVKPLVSKKSKKATIVMVLASFLVVVLGVATGWFLAGTGKTVKTESGEVQKTTAKGEVLEAGEGDEKSFGSSVEGVLKKGGIKGEGTHYIDRGLGESKYVYLTSSLLNLDDFLDKKVTVWGETISAKYASWLIDVGKVRVSK